MTSHSTYPVRHHATQSYLLLGPAVAASTFPCQCPRRIKLTRNPARHVLTASNHFYMYVCLRSSRSTLNTSNYFFAEIRSKWKSRLAKLFLRFREPGSSINCTQPRTVKEKYPQFQPKHTRVHCSSDQITSVQYGNFQPRCPYFQRERYHLLLH